MEHYFGFAKELLDKGLAKTVSPYGKDNLYDLVIQFQDDADLSFRKTQIENQIK